MTFPKLSDASVIVIGVISVAFEFAFLCALGRNVEIDNTQRMLNAAAAVAVTDHQCELVQDAKRLMAQGRDREARLICKAVLADAKN